MKFHDGRYVGKTLRECGELDERGVSFLRWACGHQGSFSWGTAVDWVLMAQSMERLVTSKAVFPWKEGSWGVSWAAGKKPGAAASALFAPVSVAGGGGEGPGSSEEDDDDEEEEGGGAIAVAAVTAVRARPKRGFYRMHPVQKREFEKVRDGVTPNAYGNARASDPGFWERKFIDPVDPSQVILKGAPSAAEWSIEPARDHYLLRRIYLVHPSAQYGIDQVCAFDGFGCAACCSRPGKKLRRVVCEYEDYLQWGWSCFCRMRSRQKKLAKRHRDALGFVNRAAAAVSNQEGEYDKRHAAYKATKCEFHTYDRRVRQLYGGSASLNFVSSSFPSYTFRKLAVKSEYLDSLYKRSTGGEGNSAEAASSLATGAGTKKNRHWDVRRKAFYSLQLRCLLLRSGSVQLMGSLTPPVLDLPETAQGAGESLLSHSMINDFVTAHADERGQYRDAHQKAHCRRGVTIQIDHHMKIGLTLGDMKFTSFNMPAPAQREDDLDVPKAAEDDTDEDSDHEEGGYNGEAAGGNGGDGIGGGGGGVFIGPVYQQRDPRLNSMSTPQRSLYQHRKRLRSNDDADKNYGTAEERTAAAARYSAALSAKRAAKRRR